ncbi:MAG: ATP synthase F1 subunit gamma [Holosporaceae bacterium]|nr:ATP synthase F1 subunit gamma [Holosporaceae bacterium]
MATLKELKNKINVINSTRKLTSAMKLVAGVKLRKAEQKANASRGYALELNKILSRLQRGLLKINSEIFNGRKNIKNELLIVFSSDRGLCGNFNYLIHNEVARLVNDFHENGKNVHIICVGNKAFSPLKKIIGKFDYIELEEGFYQSPEIVESSLILARKAIEYFKSNLIDRISAVYTRSYSALKREVELNELLPIKFEPDNDKSITIFEPSVDEIIDELVPYNLGIQIYQTALESITSEQSSRMTSMDNATRNADSILSELKIKYNRTRQYKITQELTEVISGANAIAEG